MGKWIRRILMIVFAAVFVFSAVMVITIKHQYSVSQKLYSDAADRFTEEVSAEDLIEPGSSDISGGVPHGGSADTEGVEFAPIKVNFDALCEEYPDVVGWIYCEGTVINYPVVQADDNDRYLYRSFDGTYSASGSIFVEAKNRRGFVDANTVLYGHHMRDGSMFAGIEEWESQEYYDGHKVMWLLTPTQDYKLVLVSGYTTSATSDTYTLYSSHSEQFKEYLDTVFSKSDFVSGIEPDPEGNYVVLSTCAYVFRNARYVLHGQLVPVHTAGGMPMAG